MSDTDKEKYNSITKKVDDCPDYVIDCLIGKNILKKKATLDTKNLTANISFKSNYTTKNPVFSPTTRWGHGGKFIHMFGISLYYNESEDGKSYNYIAKINNDCISKSPNPLSASMRAILKYIGINNITYQVEK
ncbi:MAG: hypothetical protein BAJALOKI3v1_50033 [Promethearchaeota archaeon]|nr:MAG: hypothetical protein BAJALOKI3v1_50033 [Candidatus Lokiarchaeota archaeon]